MKQPRIKPDVLNILCANPRERTHQSNTYEPPPAPTPEPLKKTRWNRFKDWVGRACKEVATFCAKATEVLKPVTEAIITAVGLMVALRNFKKRTSKKQRHN